MKVLGLDIGTTSIGWVIIEEWKEVIKSGLAISPKRVLFKVPFKK